MEKDGGRDAGEEGGKAFLLNEAYAVLEWGPRRAAEFGCLGVFGTIMLMKDFPPPADQNHHSPEPNLRNFASVENVEFGWRVAFPHYFASVCCTCIIKADPINFDQFFKIAEFFQSIFCILHKINILFIKCLYEKNIHQLGQKTFGALMVHSFLQRSP